jgi:hypothetical protein
LKRVVGQFGKRQSAFERTAQADHQSRKAAFLSAMDQFHWPAPQNYRFDRDEANER